MQSSVTPLGSTHSDLLTCSMAWTPSSALNRKEVDGCKTPVKQSAGRDHDLLRGDDVPCPLQLLDDQALIDLVVPVDGSGQVEPQTKTAGLTYSTTITNLGRVSGAGPSSTTLRG